MVTATAEKTVPVCSDLETIEQAQARMIKLYHEAGYRCLPSHDYPIFLNGFAPRLVFSGETAEGPDHVVVEVRLAASLDADFDALVDVVSAQPEWRLELLAVTDS